MPNKSHQRKLQRQLNEHGLLFAARTGDVDTVTSLIDAGCDSSLCYRSRTPFMVASIHGQLAVMRALLERHCDVTLIDGGRLNALHLACKHGQLPSVRFVLEEVLAEPHKVVADRSRSGVLELDRHCLYLAAKNRHPDVVYYLLSTLGVNPFINERSQRTLPTVFVELIRHTYELATSSDTRYNTHVASFLCKIIESVFVGKLKNTTAALVVELGSLPFSMYEKTLCEFPGMTKTYFNEGETMLHCALRQNHYAKCKLLLDVYSADVFAMHAGQNVLEYAIGHHCSTRIIEMLLEKYNIHESKTRYRLMTSIAKNGFVDESIKSALTRLGCTEFEQKLMNVDTVRVRRPMPVKSRRQGRCKRFKQFDKNIKHEGRRDFSRLPHFNQFLNVTTTHKLTHA